MKSIFLTQASLTFILALSLSACQKSDDKSNSSSPAAPTNTAVETPETQKITLEDALDAMASIGLQFDEAPSLAESELHDIKASWDLEFYRHYLKSAGPKFDLSMQIEILKNFVSASEESLRTDFSSSDLENETFADLQKVHAKAVMEAQIILAQARIGNLEKKLARQQIGPAGNPTPDSSEKGSDSEKQPEPKD